MNIETLSAWFAATPISTPLLVVCAVLVVSSLLKRAVKLAIYGGLVFVIWTLLPILSQQL